MIGGLTTSQLIILLVVLTWLSVALTLHDRQAEKLRKEEEKS